MDYLCFFTDSINRVGQVEQKSQLVPVSSEVDGRKEEGKQLKLYEESVGVIV